MDTHNQLKREPELFNQSNGRTHNCSDADKLTPAWGQPEKLRKEPETEKMVKFKDLFFVKRKFIMFCWMILLLLGCAGRAWAQSNQSPVQTVCPGNEPYLVTATPGSTYTWTITPGTSGSEWQINGTGNSISVDWNLHGVYTLSLTEGNAEGCYGPARSVVVTVNPSPTGTIAGTTTVCQNATAPLITFTGANGTAPYTFTYNINGGANLTVTTTSGNSVTVTAPTGTTGIFAYNLISVRDASATSCPQAQSGTATVTVNTLLIPTITATVNPVCFGTTGVVYTTEPGMTNYTWVVTGGIVTAGGTTTSNTVTVTWNGAAPYSVSVNYNNPGGCPASSPTIMDVTVTPLPVTSPIFHN